MILQNVLYLCALSLQVSGALVLILNYWANTKRRVLNIIYQGSSIVHREEDNTVVIDSKKLSKAYKEIITNRIAFVFIGLGYILSIFGINNGLRCWCSFFIIVSCSVVLVLVAIKLACIFSAKLSERDCVYEYDELVSMLDYEIDTNILNKEIDDLFNKA